MSLKSYAAINERCLQVEGFTITIHREKVKLLPGSRVECKLATQATPGETKISQWINTMFPTAKNDKLKITVWAGETKCLISQTLEDVRTSCPQRMTKLLIDTTKKLVVQRIAHGQEKASHKEAVKDRERVTTIYRALEKEVDDKVKTMVQEDWLDIFESYARLATGETRAQLDLILASHGSSMQSLVEALLNKMTNLNDEINNLNREKHRNLFSQ